MKTNIRTTSKYLFGGLCAAMFGMLPINKAQAQTIYVTSGFNSFAPNTIGEYNANTGASINTFSGGGYHNGIAVSGNDLFVTNNWTGIGEYDATTGAVINSSLISDPNFLAGITVSGNDVFVSKWISGYGTISEYTTSGATVNTSLVSGLSESIGMAVSGSSLFVADTYYNRIGEYNAVTGAVINASLVPGLSNPAGIAISGNDLFVTNGSTIGEYDATTGAAINASLVTGLSSSPYGIAISGSDLFVVSEGTAQNGNYNVGSGIIGEYNAITGATINASLVTGLNYSVGIAVKPVPEPSAWVMTVTGFGALLLYRRRR